MSIFVRRTRLPRFVIAAALLSAVVAPVACKKDSTAPKTYVATTNTVVPVSAAVTTAVAGTTFSLPAAGAALAPSAAGQNVAVTFAGTSTAPTATIALTTSAGTSAGSFTANVTFGSCIFTITSSNSTNPDFAVGKVITVNPCSLQLNTAGTAANGQPNNKPATLNFGVNSSVPVTLPIVITQTGGVTIGTTPVGNVPLTPTSG